MGVQPPKPVAAAEHLPSGDGLYPTFFCAHLEDVLAAGVPGRLVAIECVSTDRGGLIVASLVVGPGPWAHFGHTWAQTRAIPANHIECHSAGHSRLGNPDQGCAEGSNPTEGTKKPLVDGNTCEKPFDSFSRETSSSNGFRASPPLFSMEAFRFPFPGLSSSRSPCYRFPFLGFSFLVLLRTVNH